MLHLERKFDSSAAQVRSAAPLDPTKAASSKQSASGKEISGSQLPSMDGAAAVDSSTWSALWARLRAPIVSLGKSLAASAVALGILFGAAPASAAINTQPTVMSGLATFLSTDLTAQPRVPVPASSSVFLTWNQNIRTDKDGHLLPPGVALKSFIVEQKDANGNFVGRNIGRGTCFDNGLSLSCAYRLYGVAPGYQTFRMRAVATNPDGSVTTSAPSNEASGFIWR